MGISSSGLVAHGGGDEIPADPAAVERRLDGHDMHLRGGWEVPTNRHEPNRVPLDPRDVGGKTIDVAHVVDDR